MKKEDLFAEHMRDLAERAYAHGVPLYTDFLSMYEIHILRSLPAASYGVQLQFSGGFESAERQMAVFVPDALSFVPQIDYPISCIRIGFRSGKFSDQLTHRDVLGALLSTGIERDKIGDILLGRQDGCFFCCRNMAEMLCREVVSMKHTQVDLQLWEDPQPDLFAPREKMIRTTVASLRPDALISAAFGIARSKSTTLITEGRVFANGKLITSNGYKVRENDLFSVRGLGRCRYQESTGTSQKGKLHVQLIRYE